MTLYYSEFNEDIRVITDFLNKHGFYPDDASVVSHLWQEFSTEAYCAGWLIIRDDLLLEFLQYIQDNIMNTWLVRKI